MPYEQKLEAFPTIDSETSNDSPASPNYQHRRWKAYYILHWTKHLAVPISWHVSSGMYLTCVSTTIFSVTNFIQYMWPRLALSKSSWFMCHWHMLGRIGCSRCLFLYHLLQSTPCCGAQCSHLFQDRVAVCGSRPHYQFVKRLPRRLVIASTKNDDCGSSTSNQWFLRSFSRLPLPLCNFLPCLNLFSTFLSSRCHL